MTKVAVFFLLTFTLFQAHAQNYQLSFSATGAGTILDSVKVENLTQSTSLSIGGNDLLNLSPNVGIPDLTSNQPSNLTVFPKPGNGFFTIDFVAISSGEACFSLYDLSGRIVFRKTENLVQGHHHFSLDGIGSGTYLLKVVSDKYSTTTKIISNNTSVGIISMKYLSTMPDHAGRNPNSIKSLIDMQYNTGDLLKMTGKSGIYKTIVMLVAGQDQDVVFDFMACTDADNNHYPVVVIGTQIWMAENLKTTKYQNGDSVPNVSDNMAWQNLSSGAYCNYLNVGTYAAIFGKLYNWHVVSDVRNIAPPGWHVPTNDEFNILTTYLGGLNDAGGKLKETGTTHWLSPNPGATNESGFTALPAGFRASSSTYYYMGSTGMLWSSSEYIPGVPKAMVIGYDSNLVLMNTGSAGDACTIRCVKD